jgi:hypothetical protein
LLSAHQTKPIDESKLIKVETSLIQSNSAGASNSRADKLLSDIFACNQAEINLRKANSSSATQLMEENSKRLNLKVAPTVPPVVSLDFAGDSLGSKTKGKAKKLGFSNSSSTSKLPTVK